jgi:hypothetical protein
MKHSSLFLMILFLCLTATPVEGIELRGEIYNELQTQALNSNSALNPNNLYQLNELQYLMRGNLVVKSDIFDSATGFAKLEWVYSPVSFNSTANREVAEIYLKEMYIDLWWDSLIWRIGKYYLKWGRPVFFNPIDFVNLRRDPLQPVDQTEGSLLINVLFPVNESISVDFLAKIEEEVEKIEDIPVVTRVAFSKNRISGFGFVQGQKAQKPIYGLNLEYVYNITDELSGCSYGVVSYKRESSRKKIEKTDFGYETIKMEDKPYYAFVVGTKLDKSFYYANWLDGVSLTTEYYYDNENWSQRDFRNFLDYLNLIKNDGLAHAAVSALRQDFRNARNYIYLALDLHGLINEDFMLSFDTVTNLEDGSRIYLPSLSYSFNNYNSVVNLVAQISSGNRNSEFANNVADWQILLSLQLSF